MDGFAVFYVESNIVCMLVFGIILIHNHFNIDRQEKQIKYDHVLVVFMLYFLADSFWALVVSGTIPKTRFATIANDFMIYIFMAATMYCWLEYVMAYEQIPNRNRRINKIAVLFPFFVSTLVLILNYIFAPQWLISDDLFTQPGYNIYLVAVPYIYLMAILFYSIRKAKSEKKAEEKRKHLFIGLFPFLVIIGGIVQFCFPYIPIYCFCAMTLMLVFYIRSIEQRISMDPLTQLSNRSQLAHYISMKSNLSVEGRLTVVIMMDIDGFKAINDTFGHAEGDKALVVVSDALKKAVNNHSMPSFLCRYGGDEFILIIHPVTMDETDLLIAEIRNEISKADKELPHPLTLSVGFDELTGGPDMIQTCMKNADKKLYVEKRRIKGGSSDLAAK